MSWQTRGLHDFVMDRLTRRAYDVPVIGNIERGTYVETLVELALHARDSAWSRTETWTPWDIEHASTGARVEVKQSAAQQRWTPADKRRGPSDGRQFRSRQFNIPLQQGYWKDEAEWVQTELHRMADVYVFGWHSELGEAADQRRAESWKFYVIAERDLPRHTKTITLGRVQGLAGSCRYDDLAENVHAAIDQLSNLKTQTVKSVREPQ